jgi:hypothetical protein
LVGEVGGSEAFERHPERDVLHDPSAKVEVERLLLQRPLFSRSSEISSSAAGKSWWVYPVKTTGPSAVWKRSTSTPSSRDRARFSYLSA